MMTNPTPCPVCGGPRIIPHPAGLVFRHGQACALLTAEDATQAADLDRLHRYGAHTRPATDAERALLTACAHTVPESLNTHVLPHSAAVRRREWPALEGPT